MTRWRSVLSTVACLASASVVLAGCAGGAPARSSRQGRSNRQSPSVTSETSRFRIAVEAPMTGPEAAIGEDILRGVELAVSQSSTSHGRGRATEVIAEDDGSSAEGAERAARATVARHVVAVVGPYDSVASSALPIYKKGQVLVLGLSPSIAMAGYGVSLVPTSDQAASAEAQELVEVLHTRSVAILYDPASAACTEVGSHVRSLLLSSGVSVPAYLGLDPGTDVTAAVAQVASAHPDAFFLSMPGSEASAVAAAATVAHTSGKCLVDLTAGGGIDPQGCLAGTLPDVAEMQGGAQYASSYSSRFGSQPGIWGAFAYDSARLLMGAVEEAGSVDYQTLLGALVSVTGIQGVSGELSIDASDATRADPPVVIVDSSATGSSALDPGWAAYSGYGGAH